MVVVDHPCGITSEGIQVGSGMQLVSTFAASRPQGSREQNRNGREGDVDSVLEFVPPGHEQGCSCAHDGDSDNTTQAMTWSRIMRAAMVS